MAQLATPILALTFTRSGRCPRRARVPQDAGVRRTMFDRIWQIFIKELIEMKRDKWARFRLIVPPVIQMLIFGYAATFEVYHVSTVILDLDHSQESRQLLARFHLQRSLRYRQRSRRSSATSTKRH